MVMVTEYMVKKCRKDIMLKTNLLKFGCAVGLMLLVASCSTTKKITLSPRSQADDLYARADFAGALAIYQTLDSLSCDSAVWHNMAVSAARLKNYEVAVSAAVNVVPDSVIKSEMQNFVDSLLNYPLQVKVIEENIEYFKRLVNDKLYDNMATFYEQRSDAKLVDVYASASSEVRSECFPKYFNFVKADKSNAELAEICKNAIKDNKNQIVALKYLGIQNYNVAEADYKKSMDEYNRNKNNTTYAYLRRDLKRISAVYVKSREYLDRVHTLDPEDMQTIKYLININNRLDQPSKAKALQKLLK